MSRNWTQQQSDAINARNGSVLVSAAAGSGKTAVLVERVIRRLTDTQNPTSADRLLIVTFTKAAAGEMRERISAAIEEKLRENPEDRNLIRQQMLLPSAKICTIDSFCLSLVKENLNYYEVEDLRNDLSILISSCLDATNLLPVFMNGFGDNYFALLSHHLRFDL